MIWAGHVTRMEDKRNAYPDLWGILEEEHTTWTFETLMRE